MPTLNPIEFPSLAALTDLTGLSAMLGPVEDMELQPMIAPGFSGARLERVSVRLASGERRSLVLKSVRPAADWTAYRTADRIGREAAILVEPALSAVWEIFHCPYHAYARDGDAVYLLMEDLTEHLLPDVDQPMERWQEDKLLGSLAALHARYWHVDFSTVRWLATPVDRFAILGPATAAQERRRGSTHPLFELVSRGWELALDHVSPAIRKLLACPPAEIAERFDHLPHTLLHGDGKVANFGFIPNEKLSAFDWSIVGTGVGTLDIGYLLAVNAARLTRSKEEVLLTYRAMLEHALDLALEHVMWEDMVSAAIVGGAFMLLWSKGLALESGTTGAENEWAWWETNLERIAGRNPRPSRSSAPHRK